MKNVISIKEFDDILDALHQQDKNVWAVAPEQANATMLHAYEHSKELGKSRLDFHCVIQDTDVQPIAETCERLGITEFTITVMQGELVRNILPAFQELGIRCQGTTKVEMPLYCDASDTPVGKTIDGLLMEVVPERLTRFEFERLVSDYRFLLKDVADMERELLRALSRLDRTLKYEDNEEDEERREWCRRIFSALDSLPE